MKQTSACVPSWGGEKAVSCDGHGQWVGSGSSAICPELLRKSAPSASLFSFFDESGKLLIVKWKLWVLKIKKLCLRCRSSRRPAGLRRAVEKNVCLSVTRFAYVLGGKADKGENQTLCLHRTFCALEISRSVGSSGSCGAWCHFSPRALLHSQTSVVSDHCPHALQFSLGQAVPDTSPATFMCELAAFFFLFSHPTYQWRDSWQTVLLCGSQILSGGESAERETVGKWSVSGEVDGTRRRAEPSCSFYVLMAWGLSKMEQHLKTCALAQNTHAQIGKRRQISGKDLWEFIWGG